MHRNITIGNGSRLIQPGHDPGKQWRFGAIGRDAIRKILLRCGNDVGIHAGAGMDDFCRGLKPPFTETMNHSM